MKTVFCSQHKPSKAAEAVLRKRLPEKHAARSAAVSRTEEKAAAVFCWAFCTQEGETQSRMKKLALSQGKRWFFQRKTRPLKTCIL